MENQPSRTPSARTRVNRLGSIRFAGIDLDGTLIDEFGRPYPGVQRGLEALRAREIVPVLITGRTPTGFSQLAGIDLLLRDFDDEVLLCQGNTILSRSTQRLRHVNRCGPQVLERLVSIPRIDMVLDTGSSRIATSRLASTAFARAYRISRSTIPVAAAHSLAIGSFSEAIIFGGGSSARNWLTGLPCQVSSFAAMNAEVVRPLGTDKATALRQHLRTRFGQTDLLKTLTLGNGADDATMLAHSAFGIATREADPSALASASLCLTVSVGRFLLDLDDRSFAALPI